MVNCLRFLCLFLYYGLVRYLPESRSRIFYWVRYIRRWICRPIFKYAGKDINVERGAYFGSGSQIEIGNNSGIGVDCEVCGPVKIGKDVLMGPEVIILTSRHRFDNIDVPMRLQGYQESLPVEIGDDVWIGTRVVIMPGV